MLLIASLLLAACGGAGTEGRSDGQPPASTSAAPSPESATTTPTDTPPDAARGRLLYQAVPGATKACINCHTEPWNNVNNILKARQDPAVIANAIATNKGGMGSVFRDKLSDQDLIDLAEYLFACRTQSACIATFGSAP